MKIDKDIISKIIFSIFFIGISLRIIIPIILDRLKGKKLGVNENTNNIDQIINGKKNLLRSQYGLTPNESKSSHSEFGKNEQLNKFHKELSWGGQKIVDQASLFFKKNFSYTPSETRINQTIRELKDSPPFSAYISSNPEKFEEKLHIAILNKFLIDEIVQKDFHLIELLAKKFFIKKDILALGIQIQLLKNSRKNFDENKIYSSNFILHQISDKNLTEAVLNNMPKSNNANLLSSLIENLSPEISLAEILTPFPELQSKNDLETAKIILEIENISDLDKMKAKYKKLVQIYHPDKISPKKLPPNVQKMANIKFKQIQSAWEIVNHEKSK